MKKAMLLTLTCMLCLCTSCNQSSFISKLKEVERNKLYSLIKNAENHDLIGMKDADVTITDDSFILKGSNENFYFDVKFNYTKDFTYTLNYTPILFSMKNKDNSFTTIEIIPTFTYTSSLYDSLLSADISIDGTNYSIIFDFNRMKILDKETGERLLLNDEIYDHLFIEMTTIYMSISDKHNYLANMNTDIISILFDKIILSEHFIYRDSNSYFSDKNGDDYRIHPYISTTLFHVKINNDEIIHGTLLDPLSKAITLLAFIEPTTKSPKDIPLESLVEWLTLSEEPDITCYKDNCLTKEGEIIKNLKSGFTPYETISILTYPHVEQVISETIKDFKLSPITENILLKNGIVQNKDDNAYSYKTISDYFYNYYGFFTQTINEDDSQITLEVFPYEVSSGSANHVYIKNFDNVFSIASEQVQEFIDIEKNKFKSWTIKFIKTDSGRYQLDLLYPTDNQ